ncbi:MAG: repeat protein [Armatimonadetes bacterium]|jgi:tetratricopeptide (TPR) repeat protein|nr:repeat protein [Armatimonadota bacterium]
MPPIVRKWLPWVGVIGILLVVLYFAPDVVAWQHERALRGMTLEQLQAQVQQHPEDTAAHYRLGLAYVQQDRQLDATREFLVVIQNDPGRAEVLNDLGVSYMLQERYHESRMALDAAIEARPRYGRAKANMGRLRMATRMPYTAVKDLETAVEWDAKDAAAWADLGQAYQEIQQFGDAERAYIEALKANERLQQARVGLGQVYSELGRPDEAERVLRDAVKREPENPVAAAALGHLLVERGTAREEARTLLQRAVEKAPSDPEVHYDLGRVALAARDLDAAGSSLSKALSLSPEHTGAMTQLQRLLRLQGKDAEAERWAKKLRETSFRAREVRRLEERVGRDKSSWDDRARLAELYIEQGRLSLANIILREMQTGAPTHPQLERLKRVLLQRVRGAPSTPANPSAPPAGAPGPRP